MKSLIQNSIHFILLILFFVLNGWNNYYELVSLVTVIKVIAILCIGAFILFVSLTKLTGNIQKSGLFILIFSLFTLFFNLIKDTSKFLVSRELKFETQIIILLGLLFFFLFLIKIQKNDLKKFIKYSSILMILFVLFEVMNLVVVITEQKKVVLKSFFAQNIKNENKEKYPSVYLIVLDEYAGETSLENNFSYSNKLFLDSLKKIGFKIIEKSTSNYKYTLLSMNSMFNGEYLKSSIGEESYTHKGYKQALVGLNSNKTTTTFEQLGYKIVNYSPFLINGIHPAYKNRFVPSDELLLLFPTMYDDFADLFLPYLAKMFNSRGMIKKIYSAKTSVYFELLKKSYLLKKSDNSAPVFCYIHLMMPHGPYVFDENGNYNYDYLLKKDLTEDDYQKAYLQYLTYTNKVILEHINNLKKATEDKAIIMLMSDHGSRESVLNKMEIDKFNCLNAIYYPGSTIEFGYNNMSNINQFRILFSELTHSSIPLMKDSIILQ